MNAAALILEPSLATDGFAVCAGRSVLDSLAGGEGPAAFQRGFDRLPPDEYLAPDRSFRFRRFSELSFSSATGQVAPLAGRPFVQSSAVNPLYGDLARRFAPLEPALLASRFVSDLVAFDHEFLAALLAGAPGGSRAGRASGSSPGRSPETWRVGLHQIRVIGTETLPGEPTPEGIHRDGHRFVAVHLLARRNVAGGTFRIHDDEHRTLFEYTKRNLLDTLFLDDPRVKHSVTPIRPLDPKAGPAERDVLLVTWDVP